VLFSLIGFVVMMLASAARGDDAFQAYQRKFAKRYADAAETMLRRAMFETRLAEIEAHNLKKGASYRKGVNALTDRTDAERAALLGRDRALAASFAADRLNSNTRTSGKEPTRTDSAHKASAPRNEKPASMDWREMDVISPVKNQGSCGSCWAHAATESIETYVAMATNAPPPVLSVQQVVSCAANEYSCGGTGGCGGSIAELAFTYAQLYGLTSNASYPYEAVTGSCEMTSASKMAPVAAVKMAPVATVSGYEKLPENDLDAVLDALVEVGPLAVNVDASAWHDYEGGVFDACSAKNTSNLNHVVQLVGYGRDDDLGLNYWLVRNSWGTTYGEDGYIRLLRPDDGAAAPCATDVTPLEGTGCLGGSATQYVCGECGVLFDVSYPLGAQMMPAPVGGATATA